MPKGQKETGRTGLAKILYTENSNIPWEKEKAKSRNCSPKGNRSGMGPLIGRKKSIPKRAKKYTRAHVQKTRRSYASGGEAIKRKKPN